jgi:hypothetical protein
MSYNGGHLGIWQHNKCQFCLSTPKRDSDNQYLIPFKQIISELLTYKNDDGCKAMTIVNSTHGSLGQVS